MERAPGKQRHSIVGVAFLLKKARWQCVERKVRKTRNMSGIYTLRRSLLTHQIFTGNAAAN